jgi:Transposase DNA-binding/Transposase DDE domain
MKNSYSLEVRAHTKLVDHRLEDRFGFMVDTLLDNFGKSIPQSFVSRSQVKAAYNFFNNPSINYSMLIANEQERLLYRLRTEQPKVVLAIQDTTELTYTNKRSSNDMGCMRYEQVKGFYCHNHLFFTPQSIGLGVFNQTMWNYSPDEVGKQRDKRKQRAFEDKASYRWYEDFDDLQNAVEDMSETTFISITDREGDIHELLQARLLSHVHYIIRGRGDRTEHLTKKPVKECLNEQPVSLCYEIKVPEQRKEGKVIPKRTARVSLSYHKMTLHPPYRKSGSLIPTQATEVSVVYVNEIDPPVDVQEPIEWVLYTSLPINNAEDALQIVDYYKLRWLIEIFHFVLKQGAQVEKLQLATPQALQNAIVTYSMVALQIQNLRYLAVEHAEQELDAVNDIDVTPQDYQMLATFLNKTYKTKHEILKIKPTVRDFFNLIAQLGGFQMQKNKSPGVKIIWRGWQQWVTIRQMARIMRN